MTDKQIIVTFSDGYCIVLEDNKVSIRENEFTKLCIVVGNRTNELLEFVKNIYLDNKRKEQECEELKKDLRRSFKEKDTLHLIIDRLLEAGGYDTNTASAEDFEDVYENIRYEKQQLQVEQEKVNKLIEYFKIDELAILDDGDLVFTSEVLDELITENSKYEQTLTEIKEIAYELTNEEYTDFIEEKQKQILNKISEVIKDE